MKHFLFFVVLMASFTMGKAQDQLFKKDNTKLLVKIVEVTPVEIKYRLYSNLTGPLYVENKSNISLIIYENGQHQSFETDHAQVPTKEIHYPPPTPKVFGKIDSARFYRFNESVSVNFFNFINNEIGLIYQKDLYKHHVALSFPVAIGLGPPGVTQSVYFNSANIYELKKKIFEVGFGLYYLPNYSSSINFYIGPCVRYMQYDGIQYYYNPFIPMGLKTPHKSVLSRYTISITNGYIFRTKSRLSANIFGSLGIKNDAVSSAPADPFTKSKLDPIRKPFSFFFWAGFTVGFSF